MARDSFIFYRSFAEAIDDLPDKEQLELYRAIKEYALNGQEIELTGLGKTFWKLIKPQLTANNKRYENGKKGAEYGKLGGRPTNNPNGDIKENPKKTPNKNVNVNVNENADADVNGQPAEPAADSFYIQKIAKSLGFNITPRQALPFIEKLDQSWLTGENNFLVFAAEKIKFSGKPPKDYERLFVRAYSQDFYLNEYPTWLLQKIKQDEEKAKEVKQEKARKNHPTKCEFCGSEELQEYSGSYQCKKCFAISSFNKDKIKWEWRE